MLKRVPISSLRVGMYVQELGGAWLDHPFWRSSFKIDSPEVLRQIVDSRIREAWIDTSRGLDVAGGIDLEQAEAQVEQELARDAEDLPVSQRVPTEDEVARAKRILARSCQVVTEVFQQARMGRALQPETVMPVIDDVAASVQRNPGVLTALTRLRRQDTYTYFHSVSVCALMVALANQLGCGADGCRDAGLAGLMHDVGKLLVPLELLNKKEPLSEAEFSELRRHAEIGHELLARGNHTADVVLDVCLHHHERVDGSGYPEGLAGDQVSLFARMAAISDVYDATTSDRPYKDAWQPAYVLRRMTEWSGAGQFDTRIFHAFVKTVGIYPIGSLVRLKSGRLAVVVDQSAGSLLRPRVKIIFSITADRRLPPRVVDLSLPDAEDEIVGHEDPDVWGVDDIDFLWSGIDRRPG